MIRKILGWTLLLAPLVAMCIYFVTVLGWGVLLPLGIALAITGSIIGGIELIIS